MKDIGKIITLIFTRIGEITVIISIIVLIINLLIR